MSYDLADLQSKKIYIFGLGREGFSTYQFLRQSFPEKKLVLLDDQAANDLPEQWYQATENPYSTITTPDTLTKEDVTEAVLFKSPGIPPSHPLLKKVSPQTTISSNTNLFFQLVGQLNEKQNSQEYTTIGVTGTKGKSTTAALIHHLLKKAGKDSSLGGNIGVPALDLLNNQPTKIFVLELSSHQLRDLNYSPNFAVIQNITPEHLDYYQDFRAYVAAKAQLVQFQTTDDFVLYNPLYELPTKLATKSLAEPLTFGTRQTETNTTLAYVANEAIYYQQEVVAELDELPLKGEHNLENVLPAVVIAKQLEIATTSVREGLLSFQPLAHRLEKVATINQVTFVNDSLSTTPTATIAALHAYSSQPIVLIAGGYDRQQDFSQLAQEINRHDLRGLIYFNPSGERLVKQVKQDHNQTEIPMKAVETMAAAVESAMNLAEPDSLVLLSPASASFANFKDYKDRGNQFKQAVLTH